MKKQLKLLIIPILLLMFLIVDGVLAIYFIAQLISPTFQMAIQLYATFVFLLAIYIGNLPLEMIILVVTLMYDAYYSPLLSFYTIPILIVYIVVKQMAKQIPKTFIANVAMMSIANILYNCLVYMMATMARLNTSPFLVYVNEKVIPTMLFNLVLLFIIYIPTITLLKKLTR